MIPRTYPSTFAPNGQQQMVVYFLTSVVGLQRWVDYIPVKLSAGGVENSYNNNGYINVAIVPSLGGTVQAWKDYIPVYQDAVATDAWQVSSVGYIPYNYSGFGDASLILDFTNGGALDSRVTFTRTTSGTYFDSSGILRNSPANLLLQSQALATAPWFNSTLTSIANNTTDLTAPDGTSTATKIVSPGGAAAVGQGKTLTTDVYSASIWLRTLTGTVTTDFIVYLSGAPFTSIGSRTITVTSTWQRFTLTTTTATAVSYNFQLNGIGAGTIYAWGAQLETGSTATNYIPTTTAINYAPRFDYNPVTRQPLGLLIEESRTNLVLNSATLVTQSVTVTGVAHTLSFYGTGTVVISGTGTGTLVGSGAFPTRSTLTFTPTVGVVILTVTGTVTLAQLEAGAFATSYIPTTTAEATRAADNAVISTLTPWFNATEGTFYFSVSLISPSYSSGVALDIGAGGAFGTTEYVNYSGTIWGLNPNVAPLNVTSLLTAAATAKVAVAIKANDSVVSANGLIGVVDTSCAIAASPTTLSIGKGGWSGATNYLNGTISSITYFPRRLSNAELQRLTT